MHQVIASNGLMRRPRERSCEAPAAPSGQEQAFDVYRLLAERGAAGADEIAARLQLPLERVRAVAAELCGLRLIREMQGRFVAVPHGHAVDQLLAEHISLVAQALEHLKEGRRRLRLLVENRSVLDPGEAFRITSTRLGGPGHANMLEPPTSAREGISALHPGGTFDPELLARSLTGAQENLRRGVRIRVVHQSSALKHPAMVDYLSRLAALGCGVRVRSNLPFQLVLVDATAAACTIPNNGSYLLRGGQLIALLQRMFETTWVDAMSLEQALAGVPGGGPAADAGWGSSAVQPIAWAEGARRARVILSPAHEVILRLLAEGATDQAIARSMGITTRTVTRRIGEIYDALGVESRFQAGIAAKSLGVV